MSAESNSNQLLGRSPRIFAPCLFAAAGSFAACGGSTAQVVDAETSAANAALESESAVPYGSAEAAELTENAEANSAEATAATVPATLAAYLTGVFDSSAQAAADETYFNVQLKACPVDAPEFGEHVLWIEQSIVGSTEPPYRQRLYRIGPDATNAAGAVSEVFEFSDPSPYTGFCEGLSQQAFVFSDAAPRTGCDVRVTWDGTHFSGGTVGTGCASSRQGATYATSEVTIDATSILSWDRGFDAAAVQVWGATAGPYRFVRRDEE